MKHFIMAAGMALVATQIWADDLVKVKAAGNAVATMDALQSAVESAGATVFARVDHSGGAAAIGKELPASQLLIFGNPRLGTPAMQDNPLAGLYLPLKVLVYEDTAGQTWLVYEDPAAMLSGLDIAADADYLNKMKGALTRLTGQATGE